MSIALSKEFSITEDETKKFKTRQFPHLYGVRYPRQKVKRKTKKKNQTLFDNIVHSWQKTEITGRERNQKKNSGSSIFLLNRNSFKINFLTGLKCQTVN